MPEHDAAAPVRAATSPVRGVSGGVARPTVGILALQGGVAEHAAMLETLGARVVPVRTEGALTESSLDGLVLPGGESSTVDRLLRRFQLRDPLVEMLAEGLPVLGTCAGMILLAEQIVDPAPGQQSLAVVPISVQRNAFGPQADSATEMLETTLGPVNAAFIRAPAVVSAGDGVAVVARRGTDVAGDGPIVGVATDQAVALSFHPELTGDVTFHHEFLDRL
ncbi:MULTISPECIES: pyridoxal 5'-phosphate synthase glutaminase subunit PdxT [Kocuria]|uniref:Pyridoxal 5'-phosphate synthase subunit PdxT n=1 Tax=Kocuria subflava TaxID=1736139 RepID=A0A846TWW0_9MICC|nr:MULTISPECIES: pyridoxal 5'-phosphate synthase glutaminase subunit PdxT [Kocuria]NKE10134.1 pyridoxal 5'-phosphate synthase glutaminase subunit PdxT [Kocuria subflava]